LTVHIFYYEKKKLIRNNMLNSKKYIRHNLYFETLCNKDKYFQGEQSSV